MTRQSGGYLHSLLNNLLEALDDQVKSPPPDSRDTIVEVRESLPSLGVPIPDDPSLRMALYRSLGSPVDHERVDNFLNSVWSEDVEAPDPIMVQL